MKTREEIKGIHIRNFEYIEEISKTLIKHSNTITEIIMCVLHTITFRSKTYSTLTKIIKVQSIFRHLTRKKTELKHFSKS